MRPEVVRTSDIARVRPRSGRPKRGQLGVEFSESALVVVAQENDQTTQERSQERADYGEHRSVGSRGSRFETTDRPSCGQGRLVFRTCGHWHRYVDVCGVVDGRTGTSRHVGVDQLRRGPHYRLPLRTWLGNTYFYYGWYRQGCNLWRTD